MDNFFYMGGKKFPPGLFHNPLAGAGLFCLIFLLYFPYSPLVYPVRAENDIFLVVKQKNQTILKIPVRANQIFIIKYTHSVALSPVEDFFKIEDKKIRLEKTVYMDFGAGLPHSPDSGQKMAIEKGRISISGYRQIFNKFDVRVGKIANHQLILRPPQDCADCPPLLDIPLKYLSKPGSALTFTIEN